jgi:hypothetical protein
MKGSPRRKWYMVLSVALALTVMASIAPVAHAATYDSPACVSSANILKACKAAGRPVSPVQAASVLRACKGYSVSAADVAAAAKACRTSGSAVNSRTSPTC